MVATQPASLIMFVLASCILFSPPCWLTACARSRLKLPAVAPGDDSCTVCQIVIVTGPKAIAVAQCGQPVASNHGLLCGISQQHFLLRALLHRLHPTQPLTFIDASATQQMVTSFLMP